MELTDFKKNNTNAINVTDSLNAPLLRLEVQTDANTVAPQTNDLIVYVDTAAVATSDRKTYVFTLTDTLKYLSGVSDRFVIEPKFENGKVKIHTYVGRNISNGAVLVDEEVEELDNQVITLFEGANYITTNYSDALLSIVYPKNDDLVKYLLNTITYAGSKEGQVLTLDDLYFKDCFTEVNDDINLDVNNLNVSCITSRNNSFSLDSSGNLVVNTITTLSGGGTQSQDITVNSISSTNNTFSIDSSGNAVANSLTLTNYSNIINKIYPVGSIYMSVSSTNPSTLFGGTWAAWGSGRVPVGINTSDSDFNTVEKTGGNKTHTHTVGAHSHSLDGSNAYAQVNYTGARAYLKGRTRSSWTPTDGLSGMSTYSQKPSMTWGADVYGQTQNSSSFNSGSSSSLQPYITCYMWKRTA